MIPPTPVLHEDAVKYLIAALKKDRPHNTGYGDYGYDLYVPNVIREYVSAEERIRDDGSGTAERRVKQLSPAFFSAAWELSRRGIVRPGVKAMGEQSTQDGGAGAGFSVTPFGREWLKEADDTFVPTEPERFAQLIAPFRGKYGPGFHQRAQEAIRCYGAHAFLACCVMCGAASESILLSVAIAKNGNEHEVLNQYRSASGRSKIENLIIGKASAQLRTAFLGLTDLLKYWRDESAHGSSSAISDVEAYTSLALLLRFAQFSQERWSELTAR
jgi:hypothetical protein